MTNVKERLRARIESPVGDLVAHVVDGRLVALDFGDPECTSPMARSGLDATLTQLLRELREYFEGRRRDFGVPLAPQGTPFQCSVWDALLDIPYGRTVSYAEIARRIGQPSAVRAVGLANGRNPIPILIPCHRVIGADGSLTGYGGGLAIKQALLALEGAWKAPSDQRTLPFA